MGIPYCKPRAPTHRVLKAHLLRDLKVLFSNSTSPSVVLVPSACRPTSGRVTAALASAMVRVSKTFPSKKFAMKIKFLSTGTLLFLQSSVVPCFSLRFVSVLL